MKGSIGYAVMFVVCVTMIGWGGYVEHVRHRDADLALSLLTSQLASDTIILPGPPPMRIYTDYGDNLDAPPELWCFEYAGMDELRYVRADPVVGCEFGDEERSP